MAMRSGFMRPSGCMPPALNGDTLVPEELSESVLRNCRGGDEAWPAVACCDHYQGFLVLVHERINIGRGSRVLAFACGRLDTVHVCGLVVIPASPRHSEQPGAD